MGKHSKSKPDDIDEQNPKWNKGFEIKPNSAVIWFICSIGIFVLKFIVPPVDWLYKLLEYDFDTETLLAIPVGSIVISKFVTSGLIEETGKLFNVTWLYLSWSPLTTIVLDFLILTPATFFTTPVVFKTPFFSISSWPIVEVISFEFFLSANITFSEPISLLATTLNSFNSRWYC